MLNRQINDACLYFQLYDDDVYKLYPKYRYIPTSAVASFLDEYGSKSVPTADRLNELMFSNRNNDDIIMKDDVNDDVDADLESMYPERFDDDSDSLTGQRSEDKLVSARAKRMGFMLPIQYQRFIRNYATRHEFPG